MSTANLALRATRGQNSQNDYNLLSKSASLHSEKHTLEVQNFNLSTVNDVDLKLSIGNVQVL